MNEYMCLRSISLSKSVLCLRIKCQILHNYYVEWMKKMNKKKDKKQNNTAPQRVASMSKKNTENVFNNETKKKQPKHFHV